MKYPWHKTMGERKNREEQVTMLKEALYKAGETAITNFLGKSPVLDDDVIDNLITKIVNQLSDEDLEKYIKKYCCGPYYVYTGPVDTREKDNWADHDAYERKEQRTPTGSIVIEHPDIRMMCRVTDKSDLPGFLITCKDNDGNLREVQVYFNEYNNKLTITTSNETDKVLYPEDRVRVGLDVPFKDITYYEKS